MFLNTEVLNMPRWFDNLNFEPLFGMVVISAINMNIGINRSPFRLFIKYNNDKFFFFHHLLVKFHCNI